MGSTLLLFDEDLCATNFMVRDDIMRRLVKLEPITPLIERVPSVALWKLMSDTWASLYTGCLVDSRCWWMFRLSHGRFGADDGKL